MLSDNGKTTSSERRLLRTKIRADRRSDHGRCFTSRIAAGGNFRLATNWELCRRGAKRDTPSRRLISLLNVTDGAAIGSGFDCGPWKISGDWVVQAGALSQPHLRPFSSVWESR